jgi:hypothetical protein
MHLNAPFLFLDTTVETPRLIFLRRVVPQMVVPLGGAKPLGITWRQMVPLGITWRQMVPLGIKCAKYHLVTQNFFLIFFN